MTRTGRLPRLMAHQREPLLDVHPEDATRLRLTDGHLARLESPHGETILPVRLTANQRRGEVFAPMHWTDRFTSAGPILRVIGPAADPASGQPELKATPVRVMPVETAWRGLLLRASEQMPHGPYYWSRMPIERGNAFTLMGYEPLPSGRGTEMWITALLDIPPNPDLVICADPRRSIFRYASFAGSRLEACLLLARDAASLPSGDSLALLLGTKIAPEWRRNLLAGTTVLPRSTSGETICACFEVGLEALHCAIARGQVANLDQIAVIFRGGTNCGSCIPELKAILKKAAIGDRTSARQSG